VEEASPASIFRENYLIILSPFSKRSEKGRGKGKKQPLFNKKL